MNARDESAPEAVPDPNTPAPARAKEEFDEGAPVGPTPAIDFWDALYSRRSIRKFEERAVPREMVAQVLHAGIWAPSSCNYQMWDVVAVDDPEVNAQLAQLSTQMGNAPVNLVVAYGRDFSEEHWANIQSASAMIQNMSLAAGALGLGTFWITQMGNAERVRELVGLPTDRIVVAVLALGFPRITPKKGPKRRPLAQVTHWNHYAGRPIPASVDPADWEADLLAIYQRARVLNGLRHNKPRPWEVRALESALERLVPEGAEPAESGASAPRWLDVLPCTGILTERLARLRKGFAFDVVERSPEVADWVSKRTKPRAGKRGWPESSEALPAPEEGAYDLASVLFRFEDLAPEERARLWADLARWVKPGGSVLLGYVSAASFHPWTERMRARRGGPGGVEYVLSPDPNIGPFEALSPRAVEEDARRAGFRIEGRLGLQAVPQPEEIAFRTRNFSARSKKIVGLFAGALAAAEKLPGVQAKRGRFRFLRLVRAE